MDEQLTLPEMVFLKGGIFVMGSNNGRDDEFPPHEVELDSFHIAPFPITNAEYAIFLRRSSAGPPPSWGAPEFSHLRQPVVAVNWFEANAYCEWLSSIFHEKYRLPTEAEREFACRAGTSSAYPWGDHPEADRYASAGLDKGPAPVGGFRNAFGLYNMADNVHEWCSDWYGKDYYSRSPKRNPLGPESGSRRASRGGSWRHHVKVTRSAARSAIDPSFRYTDYGFRIAKS